MFKIPWSWFFAVTIVTVAVRVLAAPTESLHNNYETTTLKIINDDSEIATPITEEVTDRSTELIAIFENENEIETETETKRTNFSIDAIQIPPTVVDDNFNLLPSTERATTTDPDLKNFESQTIATLSNVAIESVQTEKDTSDTTTSSTSTDTTETQNTSTPVEMLSTFSAVEENDVQETTVTTRDSADPRTYYILESARNSDGAEKSPFDLKTSTELPQATSTFTEDAPVISTDSTLPITATAETFETNTPDTTTTESLKVPRSSPTEFRETTTATTEAPDTTSTTTKVAETETTISPNTNEQLETIISSTKEASITKQSTYKTTTSAITTIEAPSTTNKPETTTPAITETTTATTITTTTTTQKKPDTTTPYVKTTLSVINEPFLKSSTIAVSYYDQATSEIPPQLPPPPPTTHITDELEAVLAAVMPEFTSEPHQIIRGNSHEGRSLNIPARIHRLLNEDGVEVLSGYSIVQLSN